MSGAVAASGGGIPLPRALESLRLPSFRMFLGAMLCFTAAMQMQMVAGGWLVFHITGANLALGMVASMWSIALLFLSPLGGVMADRMDQRRLLILTWGGAAGLFSIIAALILTDRIQVWHLIVAAFFNGAFFAFNIPARFVLISKLVGDARLIGAMGLVSVTFNFSGILFPLLSGGLIDLVGPGGVYLLIAVLYLLSALVIWVMPREAATSGGRRGSVLHDMVAGVLYLRQDPALAWLFFLGLVAIVLGQPYGALLPGFAADTLSVPASGLGLLFAAIGLGALAGNLLVASLANGAPLARWMFLLGVISGAALVWLALARGLYPALGALFVLGLVGPPFFTLNQTLVQLLSAPEIRGRVLSLYMLTWAAMPVGIVPLTAVADRVGITVPLLAAGVAMVVIMALVAWLRPGLRGLSGEPARMPGPSSADQGRD